MDVFKFTLQTDSYVTGLRIHSAVDAPLGLSVAAVGSRGPRHRRQLERGLAKQVSTRSWITERLSCQSRNIGFDQTYVMAAGVGM